MNLRVFCALGLGNGEKFSHVSRAAVAKSDRAGIVGKIDLNLELAPVPACLGAIIVWMYHGALFCTRAVGSAQYANHIEFVRDTGEMAGGWLNAYTQLRFVL